MLKRLFLLTLCAGSVVTAQTTNNGLPASSAQTPSKKQNEITIQGCIGKQNGDYVLIQTDPGNTYQLEKPRKLHLASYLGQQVEVTGTEYPSMATSSDYLARAGVASPVTVRVKTIKTIGQRCSAD